MVALDIEWDYLKILFLTKPSDKCNVRLLFPLTLIQLAEHHIKLNVSGAIPA